MTLEILSISEGKTYLQGKLAKDRYRKTLQYNVVLAINGYTLKVKWDPRKGDQLNFLRGSITKRSRELKPVPEGSVGVCWETRECDGCARKRTRVCKWVQVQTALLSTGKKSGASSVA